MLAALAGVVAGALPLLFVSLEAGELDVFLVGVAIANSFPFGLLIALTGQLSGVARWLALALSFGAQALAYYDVLRPDQTDGQAALAFLFLPFYLTVLVFLVWAIDALGQAFRRRIRRERRSPLV